MAKSRRKRGAGSPTNASEAVDRVSLPSRPTTEQAVDEGVEESFPASDPVAAAQPHKRMRRGKAPAAPAQPPRRSPDWMLEKKK